MLKTSVKCINCEDHFNVTKDGWCLCPKCANPKKFEQNIKRNFISSEDRKLTNEQILLLS